ncbi:hypothetical protein PVT71_17290 [Salipiger sp. H15]|uniref:Uncharacterized protein n=1 Tax=Alloyangia sp. H15 TaxID=3029062 RepID=A0AAU8AN43_9RHOB
MQGFSVIAAAAALVISGSAAGAGSEGYPGDMYMPGSAGFVSGASDAPPLIQSYPAPGVCAKGTQPVILGGQIWCGVPTGGSYADPAAHGARGITATQGAPLPRAYAPAGG